MSWEALAEQARFATTDRKRLWQWIQLHWGLDKLTGISKSPFSNIRRAEKTWIVEIN